MGTSREDIKRWLAEGKKKGATHVIVVCDTFDYEDYPVFVMPNEDCRERASKFTMASMQRVMEVYSLSMDVEKQLKEYRSFNYD